MFTSSAFAALILPLLVLASESPRCQPHATPSFRDSSAIGSLQCHNDYLTHIHCSWAQISRPHLQLFHVAVFRNRSTESPCIHIPPPSQDASGHFKVHCRYNTSMFVIHAQDFFFFKVPHVRVLSKTFDFDIQEGEGPPYNLSVRKTEVGQWLLTWQRPRTLKPSPSLTYLVHFRQTGREWTELEVQGQELHVQAAELELGSVYEARVRAQHQQGEWTEWSSIIHWRPSEEPLPGPSNLACLLDGEEKVVCSWELHRELARYVTYKLSYRTKPTAQAHECCPQLPQPLEQTPSVLSYSCTLSVFTDRPLHIQLLPVPVTREFKSHRHIKPPRPTGLKVEERANDWRLSWAPPNLRTVPITTEIHYWSNDAQRKNKSFSLEAAGNFHSIPLALLQPSTHYSARIRAMVDATRSSHYSGYSSHWSETIHWTTRSVLWSAFMITYVSMAACVLVTSFLLYICQRRFRQWELSIPTPVNSKALEDISKGNQKFQVKGEMAQAETEPPHISQAHIHEPTFTSHLLDVLNAPIPTSPFPSSHWKEGHTGSILAVEEDDLYQPVPCQGSSAGPTLPVLALGSTASQGSQVSFDELYITCPQSQSSTQGVMGNGVLLEIEVCPSTTSSAYDSAYNPTLETSVAFPEVSVQPHSPSQTAKQPHET